MNKLAVPDLIAINGELAKNAYIRAFYPLDNLVQVEALRFQHLQENNPTKQGNLSSTENSNTLLVLGDYLDGNTRHQMHLLDQACEFLYFKVKIVMKFHPGCDLDLSEYINLDVIISSEPLNDLLERYSIVYSGNITSAIVEAYCLGNNLIIAHNPTQLDLSPLYGYSDIVNVHNSEELSSAIVNFFTMNLKRNPIRNKLFNFNPELCGWINILGKLNKN